MVTIIYRPKYIKMSLTATDQEDLTMRVSFCTLLQISDTLGDIATTVYRLKSIF